MARVSDNILAQCDEQPAAVALRFQGSSVTYGQLGEQVRALADLLATTSPTGPVALHSTKTPGIVVAMLACLAAAVPYVPIDPAAPAPRRKAILRDCGARALIVDSGHGARRPEVDANDATVVELGADGAPCSSDRFPPGVPDTRGSEPLAFVLYTSGSTGRPKGVCTTHDNALTFLGWAQDLIGVRPGDVVSCYAPLHFDMHIFDIFGSLAQGATVVLVDDRTIMFPEATTRVLQSEAVTIAYAVPSAWIAIQRSRALADGGLPALHTLMYSGEEYPAKHLRVIAELVEPVRIVNIYGPVETNAITALEVTPQHLAGERIPIGFPFGDSVVCLLDDTGRTVTAPHTEGELAVHTASAFVGYLGDEDATRAAFIDVDVDGRPLLCYRTGDYASRDTYGVLHFRGRRDGRVKTRGFRVEVGEVEARLLAHPQVAAAVVVTRPHEDWTNELVAYVKPTEAADGLAGGELLVWCRETLPPQMIPREVSVVATLPMTATGKADRVELARLARLPEAGS